MIDLFQIQQKKMNRNATSIHLTSSSDVLMTHLEHLHMVQCSTTSSPNLLPRLKTVGLNFNLWGPQWNSEVYDTSELCVTYSTRHVAVSSRSPEALSLQVLICAD